MFMVVIMMMRVTMKRMMMMIIIIIIVIIAFKGAFRDLLQFPHCATNCLQHVRSSGQGAVVCKSRATHRALITCNLQCATWYEETAQLLSLTELNRIYFSVTLLAETINP